MSCSTNFIIATAAKGADAIAAKLRAASYREVQEAQVAVFGAPPVDGLGSAGGFKVMVRDIAAQGFDQLQEAADGLAASGNQQPGLVGLFSASARRRRRCTSISIASGAKRCACRVAPREPARLAPVGPGRDEAARHEDERREPEQVDERVDQHLQLHAAVGRAAQRISVEVLAAPQSVRIATSFESGPSPV